MSAPQPSSPSRSSTRGRILLGVLLLALFTGGAALAYHFWPAPPAPPNPSPEGLEPPVLVAIRLARQHVLEKPASAAAWGALGQTFLANELEDEASVCFAHAEQLDPANPRWPYYQAGRLLNQGNWEEALPYLRRAADRSEAAREGPVPRLQLIEALLTLGQFDEAETHLQTVLGRQPEDVRAQFDAGLLAVARQELAQARTHFERCLESPYTRHRARVQLSAICRRLGDETNAREYRRQADTVPADAGWLDPFVEEYLPRAYKKRTRYRLAEQFEQAGRFDRAVELLRPLTVDHPDDYLAHLTLGKILAQAGDRLAAERSLREALRLAPDKVQSSYYLSLLRFQQGEVFQRQGKREQAEECFREAIALAGQALERKPDYGFAHMVQGLSLNGLGQKKEALAAFEQAVRCNPEVGELHYHLGLILADLNRPAQARVRLERALLLAPPGVPWTRTARDRLAQIQKGAPAKKPTSGSLTS